MKKIFLKITEEDGVVNPKVSIIIRGKNESRWIKILLKEICNQLYKNYEIVYCDNSSEDNTIDILKKFKVKKILNIKNFSPGRALNLGINKSSGKYIVFISSHCIPESDTWLSSHIDFLEKNQRLSAAYGKQLPLPGTNSKNALDMDILFRNEPEFHKSDPYISNANAIYLASKLKKQKFDENLSNIEDRVWAVNETKKGGIIGYNPNAKVYHLHGIHQHEEESVRSKKTIDILKEKFLKNWKKCKFIKKKYYDYVFIINARREKKKQHLLKKLTKIINSSFYNNIKNPKVIIITDLKLSSINNAYIVKCQVTLEDDLKYIYKKFYNLFIKTNYVVSLNLTSHYSLKKISYLLDQVVYYNKSSGTFFKEYDGNFLVELNDKFIFENISLIEKEKKPRLKLLQWSKGCIFDTDFLRKGVYYDANTFLINDY